MQTDSTIMREKTNDFTYADSHCHLVPDWFNIEEVEQIVDKARNVNVKIIINSAIEAEHYQFGFDTLKNKGVFLTIGIDTPKVSKERVQGLKDFFSSHQDNISAIGEIGLDFHWVKEQEMQVLQVNYFKELISFAREHDKPIVIHSRGAEKKCIEILKREGVEDVLMHCFEGTEEQVREIVKMSWNVSVPTSAVFRKSFQKILHSVNIDNLMFETDSPFHSLKKGEKNDPSSIPILCRHAAKMLELDEKELAIITTENVKNFYRIK